MRGLLVVCVCLLLWIPSCDSHDNSDQYDKVREKRSTPHVVELYGVMAYEVYNSWTMIGGQMDNFGYRNFIHNIYKLHGEAIDRRFDTLTNTTMEIRVNWKGLYIADTPSKSTWLKTDYNASTQGQSLVDVTGSQTELSKWLDDKIQNFTIPVADHYIAIIPYDIGLQYGPISLCTTNSISFVTETFFNNIIEAAMTRGVARSLGARYDGIVPSQCVDNNYIMSTQYQLNSSQLNLWQFSSCSRDEIRNHLQNISVSCLNYANGDPLTPPDTAHYPGYLYSGDYQCKVNTNWTDSVVCREMYNMTYQDVCVELLCLNRYNACDSYIPAEGTPCSKTGRCEDDTCIPGPTNQIIGYPDSCVFGDIPQYVTIYGNCSQTTYQTAGYCQYSWFVLACCISCPQVRTNRPGCPYGDAPDCGSLEDFECYNNERRKECCESCDTIRSNKQGCEYGDKKNCSDVVRNECYDPGTEANCCLTCPSLRNGPAGCSYGDRDTDCTSILGQDCYEVSTQDRCCLTCSLYNISLPGCEYGDRDRDFCVTMSRKRCYYSQDRDTCCKKCSDLHTGDDSCPYGDKVGGCRQSDCGTYTTDRLLDCCGTCSSFVSSSISSSTTSKSSSGSSISQSTSTPVSTTSSATSSGNSGQQSNLVVPLAAGLGGAVFVLILVIVIICCIRRRRTEPPAPVISDQMYNDYKDFKLRSQMKERPPIPEPRNSTSGPPHPRNSTSGPPPPRPLVRQDTGTYAYISPSDVATVRANGITLNNTNNAQKREGSDPLPPTPGEYVDFISADKYGYVEPISPTAATVRARENTYVRTDKQPSHQTKIQISGGDKGEGGDPPSRTQEPYTYTGSPYQQLQHGPEEHAYSASGEQSIRF